MNRPTLYNKYLTKYGADEKWFLQTGSCDHISQIVVIPAYAEKEFLFSTLASLAYNDPSSLEDSLILCVINNKNSAPAEVKENNQQTIRCFNALIKAESLQKFNPDPVLTDLLTVLADSKIRLGYIDASSKGLEIPEKTGGVGMARKIGMDMALRLHSIRSTKPGLIYSLDADTIVQHNYLSVIKNSVVKINGAAVIAYEHQFPRKIEEQAAICCYEIFLRYWVLGLRYARSPFAFHSIGSTMVTTSEAYLKVRGMNKREAGEDFYFLNKLAKIAVMAYIKETCVYPSARSSNRVPFGTGAKVKHYLHQGTPEYLLYDPQIFIILADWLKLMKRSYFLPEQEILAKAAIIHPALTDFLAHSDFVSVWLKIRQHTKEEIIRARQFHDWFDGFKTLKLINYFTREVYPLINMFGALHKLFSLMKINKIINVSPEENLSLQQQLNILNDLRLMT
jgi:hypothetical protein